MGFALATIERERRPVACLQREGRLPPVRGAGISGGLTDLFGDWPAALAKLEAAAQRGAGGEPESGTAARLAPLLYPGKVVCAGANYYDHIAEMGISDTRKEAQRLFFFMKPPRNAVVGPGKTVRM